MTAGAGVRFAAIPAELKAIDSWVTWRYEERNGKRTKVPYNARTGERASSTNPTTWSAFDLAVRAFERAGGGLDGIGFVLRPGGGLVGIDLDHCRDTATGEIEPWALDIVRRLDSYTEVSPSGQGLRIFIRGKLPARGRKAGAIEMYEDGRYLTVTGDQVEGTPPQVRDRGAKLLALHAEIFPPKPPPGTTPAPGAAPDADDDELVRRAGESAAGGAFTRLWQGQWQGFYSSQSSADLALCNHLAFWTGGDAGRMDRLFRASGLMRPKWDERRRDETYGERTIRICLETRRGEYYTPRGGQPQEAAAPPDDADDEGEPAEDGEAEDGPMPPPPSGGAGRSPPQGDGPSGEEAEAWPPPATSRTDLGNAERLIKRHGADLRYVPRWKQWLVWDGRRWAKDDRRRVQQMAIATVRAMYAEAGAIEEEAQRKELIKHAVRSESNGRLEAMVTLASSLPGVPLSPEELDRGRWLLNCANGTLDLRTGDLRPHQREDLLTMLAPVDYDAEAEAPVWRAFLQRVMDGREGLITFLQRAVGYSLCGDTGEECMFVCYGTGRNGKSKFLGAIEYVLGDYAKPTKPETFMERRGGAEGPSPDLADLAGARLVSTTETTEGRHLAEGLLKWATGGDVIKARFLFSDFFTFRPQFKLWLAGNHKPVIRGSDEGIWSRIRLIAFTVTIPREERDRDLATKLEAEAAGILAWAVEGCLAWQIHQLGGSDEVEEATAAYREEMDLLAGFISDVCVLDPQARVSAKALYEAYQRWCETNGEQPLSQRGFGRRLTERGLTRLKSRAFGPTAPWGWTGIDLAADSA